jgi:phage shock protein A
VAYLLRMSDEIHDWLTQLRGTDPPAAVLVGQALTALMTAGFSLGPPLVTSLGEAPRPGDLVEALDEAYEDKLARLTPFRRRLADAATSRKQIQRQTAAMEAEQVTLGDQRRRALDAGKPDEAAEAAARLTAVQQQLDQARRRLDEAIEEERRQAEQAQRQQFSVEAFRARREALKATYAAAEASLRVQRLLAESDQAGGEGSNDQDELAEAAAKVRDVTAAIERQLGRGTPPEDLMELRPGAPGDIGILFGIEPSGTVLLLAVLEGREAARDQHQEAVALSAEVLQQVRAGQAPEAAARAYDDTQAFLAEFFPGDAGDVISGAAALAARNHARTLAEQRTRLGLSQAEVAQRMGVRQERVSAIERAQQGAMEVRTLAAYVEALGGRLRLVGEFGGEDIPLR